MVINVIKNEHRPVNDKAVFKVTGIILSVT
jgi:hypothetical protein